MSQTLYKLENAKAVNKYVLKYGVQAVPTAVIDGEIKVVGIPDFPWICGDELYTKLKRKYHIQ